MAHKSHSPEFRETLGHETLGHETLGRGTLGRGTCRTFDSFKKSHTSGLHPRICSSRTVAFLYAAAATPKS